MATAVRDYLGDSGTDLHELGDPVSDPDGKNMDHKDNSADIAVKHDAHGNVSSASDGKSKVHGLSNDSLSHVDDLHTQLLDKDECDVGKDVCGDQFREAKLASSQVDGDEDHFRRSYFSVSSFNLDSKIEPPKAKSKRRVGSCCNCTRKLRALSCTQQLYERHHYFFVATATIQFLLFCTLTFDPKFGFFVKKRDLPVLADCGNPNSRFSSSFLSLSISFFLNIMQMVSDALAVFLAILFVRQMRFRAVVLQYFLLALVIPRPSQNLICFI